MQIKLDLRKICCIGKDSALLESLQDSDKFYIAKIRQYIHKYFEKDGAAKYSKRLLYFDLRFVKISQIIANISQ